MTAELSRIPDTTPVTPENSLHLVTKLAKIVAKEAPHTVLFSTDEASHTHDEEHRGVDFISPAVPMGTVALTAAELEELDYSHIPEEYTD